ncbi:MAG: translation initiation factor IF-2 subunit gamma, partial [Candidatus Micrarchaeia archaeon]
LVAIQTDLDPSLAKADGLIGNVISTVGNLPPLHNSLKIEYSLLSRVDYENPSIKEGEAIVISAGTATTLGVAQKVKKNKMEVILKRPICAPVGSKIAISRRVNQRWRLAGAGKIL